MLTDGVVIGVTDFSFISIFGLFWCCCFSDFSFLSVVMDIEPTREEWSLRRSLYETWKSCPSEYMYNLNTKITKMKIQSITVSRAPWGRPWQLTVAEEGEKETHVPLPFCSVGRCDPHLGVSLLLNHLWEYLHTHTTVCIPITWVIINTITIKLTVKICNHKVTLSHVLGEWEEHRQKERMSLTSGLH